MAATTTQLAALGQLTTAGTTLVAGVTEARAIRAQAAFERRIAESNARLRRLEAREALRRGEVKAQERLRKAKQLIGVQRATLAAQGLALDEGTALALQEDAAALGALDAETIRGNAFREAWGFRLRAIQEEARGEIARIAGRGRARQALLTSGIAASRNIFGAAQRLAPRPLTAAERQFGREFGTRQAQAGTQATFGAFQSTFGGP